tara:strand:+ start:32 stop:1621 length:1590 start_codon:yes stop_codon:yes gene_type:complete
MAETTRRLTVDEANKPILDITGQDALMGVDTVNAEGQTVPGQFDLGKAEYTFDPKSVESSELLDTTGKTLGVSDVSPTTPNTAQVASVTAPTIKSASTIDNVERVFSSLPTAAAAQGTVATGATVDPNQVVDERNKIEMLERGSLAEAKTQTLAAEATTKYQVEQLMTSLNDEAELPPWVSPAVRKVRAVMNQRGLGASSMAAAAMAQSMLESAIPIANADAQKYATLQLQNLNNEQQTALTNAATISAMDKQNLDNKMKAAQQNAQTFLQMDLANLTNAQATSTLNHQTQTQALFNDASAANAASQFNATSQNQVNQFYDTLGSTVANNNANREVALSEFNVDQSNSMKKYVASLEDAREKFNANVQNLVDQSNTVWRRNVNTVNNASQNAENKYNAEVILGLSVEGMNNLWQKYRDEASQAYASGENAKQRAHSLAVTAIANQFSQDLFQMGVDQDQSDKTSQFFGGLLDSVITAGLGAFSYTTDANTGDEYDVSNEDWWQDAYENTTAVGNVDPDYGFDYGDFDDF